MMMKLPVCILVSRYSLRRYDPNLPPSPPEEGFIVRYKKNTSHFGNESASIVKSIFENTRNFVYCRKTVVSLNLGFAERFECSS